jgi:hypothetical protein
MKLLKNPVVQAVGTILLVLLALSFLRPKLSGVPLLNRL